MKKDIKIPEVTGIAMAVVKEFNDIYKTDDWNVYLINNKDAALEMVLVVSHGHDGDTITSKMRHKIETLPAHSFAKVELIQPELFKLNNSFQVSFFSNNQLQDKTFVFTKNSIKDSALRVLKDLDKKGILLK